MQQSAHRKYLCFTFALFGALWLYLFLRAWFVSPLHDEVATYFHFIEPKNFWGENASLDANNHLLNSFFGWVSYKLFGESFFAFRLPNVLSFALYFWGVYVLLKNMNPLYGFLVLLGITGIPYILEYFAYARGYGMSMACFVWILIFAVRLAGKFSLPSLFGLLFFTLTALLANLSFLGVSSLVLLWTILQLILSFKNTDKLTVYLTPVFLLLFFIAVYPVFDLGMKMKEAGTLYYGTLDGLWDVTGKTLSRYVLFYEADWLQWFFLVLIITLALSGLYRMYAFGLRKFLKSEAGVLSYFFFGAIAVILVLAEFFKVNYPEDRVGMYLVPLLLLLIAQTIHNGRMQKVLFIYPLTAISLLLHLSLNTSVFTPDERLTASFYMAVKKELGEGTSLSGYPTMELTWALHERKMKTKHFLHGEREFKANADVILMKRGMLPVAYEGYSIIAEEKGADYVALKRIRPLIPSTKALVGLQEQRSQSEYIDLAVFAVQENWKEKRIKLKITGTLIRKGDTAIETIVLGIADKNGNQTLYQPFDLRWYNGIKTNPVTFEINEEFVPGKNDAEIKIYLWNKYQFPMTIKDVFVTVSELKNEK